MLLLRDIAQLMRHQLRNSDCLARLGGDEFGLILFDCRLEQAKSLMQQVVNKSASIRSTGKENLSRRRQRRHHAHRRRRQKQRTAGPGRHRLLHRQAPRPRPGLSVRNAAKQLLERQHELLNPQEVQTIISEGQLRLLTHAVAPPATPLSAAFHQVKLQVMAPDGGRCRTSVHRRGAAVRPDAGHRPLGGDAAVGIVRRRHQAQGLSLALPLATDSLLNTDFQRDLTETVRASSLPPRALLFSVDEAVVLEHTAQCRACLRELQQLGCRLIVNGFGHNINAFDELGDQKMTSFASMNASSPTCTATRWMN